MELIREKRTTLGLLDILMHGKGAADSEQRSEYTRAVLAMHTLVIPLCMTETNSPTDTTLYDWLYEGEFHTTDTPESLAQEWDELSEPC